jgi:hypothetical protein
VVSVVSVWPASDLRGRRFWTSADWDLGPVAGPVLVGVAVSGLLLVI